MKVYWTKEAVERLNEIKLFIMKDNPIAAEKLIDKLITLAESLSKNPERGRIVPEFSIKVIRELLYKNYRIVYLLKKRRIEILTVFEGHRLIHKEEINNVKIS
ncbi:MAG: hypothetical protein KatS3mg036_0885 [Ignavibacterium sp.]|nr:MAG: hypothetical protein KatS3mg036_0885 [Ignavibacterium sp.]